MFFCLVHYLFSSVFLVDQGQKPNLLKIIVPNLASLWHLVWKLGYYCQISIILFLYLPWVQSLLKEQCSASWVQVSSSPQDSSRYSGWPQQYCSLNSLQSSSYFQVLKSLHQSFGDCTKSSNYTRHLHVSKFVVFFFHFLRKFEILILLFAFFQFYSVISQDSKVYNAANSLFLLIIIRSSRLAEMRWSGCISKSQMSLCVSFSRTDVALRKYHLFVWSNLYYSRNSQWITLPTQSRLL